MIYDDYICYTEEYRRRYGPQTVVLMQVGDFFELYGVQNDQEVAGADMHTIGDICNLTVTRKNKSILENSRTNPLMAGFPLHAISKHTQSLLDNGFTIVIIRQVTPPPNVRREVTEILSPSTTASPGNSEGNYALVFHWERYSDGTMVVGIAGGDVSTGHTFAYEVAGSKSDPMRAFDEAYRMFQSYQPREIVFTGDVPFADQTYIRDMMGMRAVVHAMWGSTNATMKKATYHSEILRKVYPVSGNNMLNPIETIGLDKYDAARLAFIELIIFIYDHNELIVARLHAPEILHDTAVLTLEYNSAVQLNVIGETPGDRPLYALMNKCCTAIGSREFKRRLLAPITDPNALRMRYDRIDHVISTRSVHQIRSALKNVVDIERLVRRMELGSLSPIDWYAFHTSLGYVKIIASEYDGCADALAVCGVISAIEDGYTEALDVDECAKYTLVDIKGNVFKKGIYPDIDEVTDGIAAGFETLTRIAETISGYDDVVCRVDSNERDGFFLQITKKRWETAIARGFDARRYTARPISAGSSVLRIQSADIEAASNAILNGQRKVATMVTAKYKEFMESFIVRWGGAIKDVITYTIDIDVATNNAYIASEYGYTRPIIKDAAASFVDIKGIRHPIIEILSTSVEYVKNDVRLDQSGMLLYGINASGKSSLMKAVGINVIMAQAGMYVAATEFEFCPFRHLFTRITTADNIYRGMSTFVVEMAELRNILQRADSRSLVLGDELCAGTESVSAIAIVSAGIDALIAKGACFIFATHLHEIEEVAGVDIYHMHIEMDPVSKKIIYDRTLKPGKGCELYGLEVCASLGMPEEFLATAHRVRRKIQDVPDSIVSPKWSRYNKEVCVDICKACNVHPATETHHILPQESASEDGFVAPGVKVHRRSNLVPLCKECHMKEHHGDLNIRGYRQTSSGVELDVATRKTTADATQYTFDMVVSEMRKHYVYRIAQTHWYSIETNRRCKFETVIKFAEKKYKYHFSSDEKDLLPSELSVLRSAACT